jgi:hypothetical protein
MKATLQDVVSLGGGLAVEAGVEPPDPPYGEAAAITLKIAGYETCNGIDDAVVLLEHYEGVPRLVVWADINNEEPTHIIDLSGAEKKRRKNPADPDGLWPLVIG